MLVSTSPLDETGTATTGYRYLLSLAINLTNKIYALAYWKINKLLYQRWSRGHKVRGQGLKKIRGQGQPFRGQTLSRPRTGMLEAKAKDQGQAQAFSKKKVFTKIFFRRSPIHWLARILIGGGLNHKSHEMTTSHFFQRGSFCGTKISQKGRSEIVACLHVTRILQR